MNASEQSAKAILEQLIRIRTTQPSGDEKDAVIFLQNLFAPWTAGDTPKGNVQAESTVVDHGDNRASLILTLPGRDRSRSVAVCGHLDTVGVSESDPWQHAPFSAWFDGERMYGRGAADMKGGVTGIALAALRLMEEGFRPATDIRFCFTADEEVGGTGAKALCDGGFLDSVTELVVVKPTNGRIGVTEKGALWLRICAHGSNAHAAMPDRGVNALEQTTVLARNISTRLKKEGKYPLLGPSTCVLTSLHGGIYPNVVPDYAEGCLDIRTSPRIGHGRLLEEIDAMIRGQEEKNRPLRLEMEVRVDRPALGMDEDAPLVRRFRDIHKKLKLPWETTGINYFTDASIFVPKLGVPFVILGPGEERFFHQPDEYVTLSDVTRFAEVLTEYLRAG